MNLLHFVNLNKFIKFKGSMKFLNINYFKLLLISNVNYHLADINKRSEKNLRVSIKIEK